ncbi:MAG: hypothetical protein WAU39_01685 [Polyangiales bacterium]
MIGSAIIGSSAEADVPNEPENQTIEVAARAQIHGTNRGRSLLDVC